MCTYVHTILAFRIIRPVLIENRVGSQDYPLAVRRLKRAAFVTATNAAENNRIFSTGYGASSVPRILVRVIIYI